MYLFCIAHILRFSQYSFIIPCIFVSLFLSHTHIRKKIFEFLGCKIKGDDIMGGDMGNIFNQFWKHQRVSVGWIQIITLNIWGIIIFFRKKIALYPWIIVAQSWGNRRAGEVVLSVIYNLQIAHPLIYKLKYAWIHTISWP